MKALVTGAAREGGIGQAIVARLGSVVSAHT